MAVDELQVLVQVYDRALLGLEREGHLVDQGVHQIDASAVLGQIEIRPLAIEVETLAFVLHVDGAALLVEHEVHLVVVAVDGVIDDVGAGLGQRQEDVAAASGCDPELCHRRAAEMANHGDRQLIAWQRQRHIHLERHATYVPFTPPHDTWGSPNFVGFVWEHTFAYIRWMTRPAADVSRVLEMSAAGHAAAEIARQTGIPRATVRDWLRGALPDRSRGRCWRCDTTLPVPDVDYARLLGAYLGDGYLARHRRDVYRLVLVQDAAYPRLASEWADLATAMLGNVATVRPRPGCFAIGSYSTHWPCLLPQHGPGRKHAREIALTDWQREIVEAHPTALLRGLIESDGSRHMNRVVVSGRSYEYPRYNFTNASADILDIFTSACGAAGVHWTACGQRAVAISRRADVAFLDTFIGPKS